MKTISHTLVLVILGGLLVGLADCDGRGDLPGKPLTAPKVEDEPGRRIADLEKAIENKDFRLPSRVKGLIRYLRDVEINVPVGPGKKFQSTEEAAQALGRVIAKLEAWFDRSLDRREETDADRAELRTIIDEAKSVLQDVHTQAPPAE